MGWGALNTSIGTQSLVMKTRDESNDGKDTGAIGNERKAPDNHGHYGRKTNGEGTV